MKNKTYTIPAEVGVALSTKRTVFIDNLKGRIEKGAVLPAVEIAGLLDLCKELVEKEDQAQHQINVLLQALQQVDDIHKGLAKFSNQMRKILNGIRDDVSGAEGDRGG